MKTTEANFLKTLKTVLHVAPSVNIQSGETIRVASIGNDVILMDKTERDFDCPIYDLSSFISLYSILDESQEIKYDVSNDYIELTDSRKHIKYRLSDSRLIETPVESHIIEGLEGSEFSGPIKLDKTTMGNLLKALNVILADYIIFEPKDGCVGVRTVSDKPEHVNEYTDIIEGSTIENSVIISVKSLSYIVVDNYELSIAENVIKLESEDVVYYIATQELEV